MKNVISTDVDERIILRIALELKNTTICELLIGTNTTIFLNSQKY